METETVSIVVVVLLIGVIAVLRRGRSGSARSNPQHGADGASHVEQLEMESAVGCAPGSQDGQPVTVTGIAVAYTPPVVEAAVADGDQQ